MATTATELARELSERSGMRELRDTLRSLFLDRRDVLKSRSALLALDSLARAHPAAGSSALVAEVEEIVASAHPFNELRVLSAVRAGWVSGKADVVAELERLVGGAGASHATRLQLPPDADDGVVRAAAADALARWQRRAENPMTDHQLAVASRVVIRSCEGILAAVGHVG
jgi:hypothetical protein